MPDRPALPPISATVPDWSRERIHGYWNRGRRLVASLRRYQAARARGGGLGRVAAKLCALEHRFWEILTQCQIPPTTRIEGGFFLPHPTGIIIHPDTEIGPNCTLFQQVTLGTDDTDGPVPKLAGDVMIGAGARVLGPVSVGAHALIGANAVVLRDVPAGATAVGVPARVIERAPGT